MTRSLSNETFSEHRYYNGGFKPGPNKNMKSTTQNSTKNKPFTYFAYGITAEANKRSNICQKSYNIWDSPLDGLYVNLSSHKPDLNNIEHNNSNKFDSSNLINDKCNNCNSLSNSSNSLSEKSNTSSGESNSSFYNSSDGSGDDSNVNIRSEKKLGLAPSFFSNGCICGHNIEYRGTVCDIKTRKHIRNGVTIRPKNPPISVFLNK